MSELKKAIVIGGGPVGMVAALLLRKSAFDEVTVLEQRPEEAKVLCYRQQTVSLDDHSQRVLKMALESTEYDDLKEYACGGVGKGSLYVRLDDLLISLHKRAHDVGVQIHFGISRIEQQTVGDLVEVKGFNAKGLRFQSTANVIILAAGASPANGVLETFGFQKRTPWFPKTECGWGVTALVTPVRQPKDVCMKSVDGIFSCGDVVDCGDFEFELPANVFWATFGRTEQVYVAVGTYNTCQTKFFESCGDDGDEIDQIVRSLVALAFSSARRDAIKSIDPALRNDGHKDSDRLRIINLDPQALRRSVKMVSQTLISVEGDSCASVNFLTGSGLNGGLKGISQLHKQQWRDVQLHQANRDAILEHLKEMYLENNVGPMKMMRAASRQVVRVSRQPAPAPQLVDAPGSTSSSSTATVFWDPDSPTSVTYHRIGTTHKQCAPITKQHRKGTVADAKKAGFSNACGKSGCFPK